MRYVFVLSCGILIFALVFMMECDSPVGATKIVNVVSYDVSFYNHPKVPDIYISNLIVKFKDGTQRKIFFGHKKTGEYARIDPIRMDTGDNIVIQLLESGRYEFIRNLSRP